MTPNEKLPDQCPSGGGAGERPDMDAGPGADGFWVVRGYERWGGMLPFKSWYDQVWVWQYSFLQEYSCRLDDDKKQLELPI